MDINDCLIDGSFQFQYATIIIEMKLEQRRRKKIFLLHRKISENKKGKLTFGKNYEFFIGYLF